MPGQPALQKVEKPEHTDRFHKFASTTVHHLREPARIIGIYTEMLRKDASNALPEISARSVELITGAAQQLQRLLESLAEFAAVSGGDSRPRSTVPLDLVLRHALLQLDSEVKASKATMISKPLPDVNGDFDHLVLVFRHLIRNAVRYGGNAAPEIVIEAMQVGGEWIIEVRDNGLGIPVEYREKVFEPYTRLHGKESPGNGLGLAVCRTVIGNHSGQIWVEPSRSGGAAFRFTLPG